jgi:hypothetical protein
MKKRKHPLQELYDAEINFEISTFWDGGFDWRLGDHINGFKDSGNTNTFDVAVKELLDSALEHYPKFIEAERKEKI